MRYLQQVSFIVLFISSFNQQVIAKTNVFEYQTYTPKQGTVVHVVTVDLRHAKLIIGRAQDLEYGLDSVENIAKHFAAVVAVNGGFFRFNSAELNSGVPAGILKLNNDWHGIAYKARGCIGWDPQTGMIMFDILQTDSHVLIKDKKLPINAMNKLSSGNKATLLSNSYHDTVTVDNSLALLILNQRIKGIYTNGAVTIPAHGYVYDVSGNLRADLANLKPGDSAIIDILLKPHFAKKQAKIWNKLPYVIGGGPLLIYNRKKIESFSLERMSKDFIYANYARTAVGVLPDKRLVLLVAEQNSFQNVIGLSIPELRDFMYSLGCVYALNLDGGGSSAMYIRNTKHSSITDHPVADALLVIPN